LHLVTSAGQSIEFALQFADPFQMPIPLLVDVVEVRHASGPMKYSTVMSCRGFESEPGDA
jgi:hypothetical protein